MSDKPFKTVYFLGAGASAASDFHLPVMDRFFRKKDLSEKHFSNLEKFIHRVTPSLDIENVNLEDIITHLDLSLEDLGATWQQERTLEQKARQELYTYIRKRLRPGGKDTAYCQLHLRLVKTLKSLDSILTLNYDLVVDFALFKESRMIRDQEPSPTITTHILERSYELLGDVRLWAGSDWPTLYHEHVGKGLYIKLHGSIDWLYCPNPLCGYHQLIFCSRLDFESRIEPGAPCSRCGTPLGFVIVPPTMRKSVERFPKLGYLWNLAFGELKQADKLIFFGVSLPKSDYLLRWLIRESTIRKEKPRELIIINLEAEKERLKRELGELTEPKKIRWYSDIREFLDAQL